MPVSMPKYVTVKAPGTERQLLCFKFGGDEFFKKRGFSEFDYIAGIVLGPNSALLVDRVGGYAWYAVEKAGYYNEGDLACAWQWILRHFDTLPEKAVVVLESDRESEFRFKVKEVKEV